MAETKGSTGGSAPERDDSARPGRPTRSETDGESGAALDPELLSIRGPRPRIGVLLSLSIIALCAYLLLRIAPDLRFALAGDEPTAVAEPSRATRIAGDSYVEIADVRLDRAAALRASKNADPALATGRRLVPVLGTGGALWVAEPGNPRAAPIRHGASPRGRLRPLADLPFASSLTERAGERGAPRYATAAALRRALESGADAVESPGGDEIAAGDATPVSISETVTGRAEIAVAATEKHPDAETWAHALADAGALSGVRPPVAAGDELWVFEASESAAAINGALADAGLVGARAEPARRVHEVAFGELKGDADALIAGGRAIPWDGIDGVWLEEALSVPEGAAVLLAGERPSDYRLVPWIAGILAAFVLLFTWALIDGIRREIAGRRPARAASKSDT